MFKGLLFFAKFSWKHRKAYLLLNIINQTILGVLPLIIVLMPKYIIDELMGQQRLQFISVYVVVLLIAVLIAAAHKCVRRMWKSAGGIKL